MRTVVRWWMKSHSGEAPDNKATTLSPFGLVPASHDPLTNDKR